jgi:hypothetical protein
MKMTAKREVSKKGSLQLSGITVLRYREPTSGLHKVQTQYVVDYSNFQKHTPDNRKGVLVEASTGTKGRKSNSMQSINPCCNKSLVFGPTTRASLGTGPDDPNNY